MSQATIEETELLIQKKDRELFEDIQPAADGPDRGESEVGRGHVSTDEGDGYFHGTELFTGLEAV